MRTSRDDVTNHLDIRKVSVEYVWASDANRECQEYLQSVKSILGTDYRWMTGGSMYLIDQVLHCLTHD